MSAPRPQAAAALGLAVALALAPEAAQPQDLGIGASTPHPFGEPLADADLAAARGGVRLPNGAILSLRVSLTTRQNGDIVLRSTLTDPSAGFDGAGGTEPRFLGAGLQVVHRFGPGALALIANEAPGAVIEHRTVVDVRLPEFAGAGEIGLGALGRALDAAALGSAGLD